MGTYLLFILPSGFWFLFFFSQRLRGSRPDERSLLFSRSSAGLGVDLKTEDVILIVWTNKKWVLTRPRPPTPSQLRWLGFSLSSSLFLTVSSWRFEEGLLFLSHDNFPLWINRIGSVCIMAICANEQRFKRLNSFLMIWSRDQTDDFQLCPWKLNPKQA